jgi:uncharacterized protein with GYD domain
MCPNGDATLRLGPNLVENRGTIPGPPIGGAVPHYLGRASYTSDAVKKMIGNPQDRGAAAAAAAESVGAKMLSFWFAFGEYDVVFIAEAPDNATIAALAMAVTGAGALSRFETTVLLDMDEAQEAMRKAATATYKPPS